MLLIGISILLSRIALIRRWMVTRYSPGPLLPIELASTDGGPEFYRLVCGIFLVQLALWGLYIGGGCQRL